VDAYNHCIDALRYALDPLMRRNLMLETEQAVPYHKPEDKARKYDFERKQYAPESSWNDWDEPVARKAPGFRMPAKAGR
jgi:hypothetical protein